MKELPKSLLELFTDPLVIQGIADAYSLSFNEAKDLLIKLCSGAPDA